MLYTIFLFIILIATIISTSLFIEQKLKKAKEKCKYCKQYYLCSSYTDDLTYCDRFEEY